MGRKKERQYLILEENKIKTFSEKILSLKANHHKWKITRSNVFWTGPNSLISGAVYSGRDPDGELRPGGHRVQAEAQRPPRQHRAQVRGGDSHVSRVTCNV